MNSFLLYQAINFLIKNQFSLSNVSGKRSSHISGNDTTNKESSLHFYEYSLNAIKYFEKVGAGEVANKDSLVKYGNVFFRSTKLQPHIRRYEALKASSEFNIVEDKDFSNNIIDLHESALTHIETLISFIYNTFNNSVCLLKYMHSYIRPGALPICKLWHHAPTTAKAV
ncbi:MAG: hypothetical protein ABI172_10960 [Ginsengibacter sp.]|jgi:hypothetical protein